MKRRGLVDRPLYRDWIVVLGGTVATLTVWHIAAAGTAGASPSADVRTLSWAAALAVQLVLGTAVPSLLFIVVPASLRQVVRRALGPRTGRGGADGRSRSSRP